MSINFHIEIDENLVRLTAVFYQLKTQTQARRNKNKKAIFFFISSLDFQSL